MRKTASFLYHICQDALIFLLQNFFELIAKDISTSIKDTPMLIIAPHPDDDVLGCGALIARARKNEQNVHVVIVTDGSASSKSAQLGPQELASLRQREACAAQSILGVPSNNLSFLGFPDGQTSSHINEIQNALSDKINQIKPSLVFAPSLHDRHTDHRVTSQATAAAVACATFPITLLYYPVWFWPHGALALLRHPSSLLRLRRVGNRGYIDQKRQALAQHKSQCENLTGEASWQPLPTSFINRFFTSFEIFFEK